MGSRAAPRRDRCRGDPDLARRPPALRRILWLVDCTGIRTGEARELEWDQILWEQSVIKLDKHKALRKQKTKKPRLIGLDKELLAELRRLYENRRHERLVFLSPRGCPWTKNNLDQAFLRLRERLGLADDLTPYCFRHRFATQCRLAGVEGRHTTAQLGHSTERMSEHYTHVDNKPELFVAAAERIAEARAARKPVQVPGEATPLFEGLE